MIQPEQAIKDFVRKEFLRDKPEMELADDQPLVEENIVDSLGIFILIGFIEKEFGIKIEPQDVVLENFETIDAIAKVVRTRLASGSGAASEG